MSIFRGGRQRFWLMLFALGAALAAEALFRSGALNPVDERLQDAWFQWQGQRAGARHVVIVAIDEDTLAAYPDDPMVFWTDRMALALSRLRGAGAQAIGLDMLLSISPERWLGKLGGELQSAARDYDRPFREEVNSGRLVLVATRAGSGARESDYLLPSPDYLLALPDFDIPGHIGLGDLLDEGDGVIRRFHVAPVAATGVKLPGDGVPVLGFPSLLAVRAAGLDPHGEGWTLGGRKVSRQDTATPIPYLGPPGTFPRISLKALLADGPLPEAVASSLRGKAVILGATAAGLNDEHFTPYATRFFSGRGALMTGVEVHANIVESLLSGERLRPMGDGLRLATLLVLAGLAVAVFVALPAWQGGLLWLLGVPLLALASFIAFRGGVLMPVAAYALVAGLALLGVLGWRLTGEERERARVRRMFGRYVSDQVVEALLQAEHRPELGGQSQTVTVLFSDIRNFTTISERLNAKEVVEMLNTYFERACAAMLAEGGSIDKFIGDAIMVEFGSPLPVADHAIRGVRAAVALRAVAGEFAGWMEQRFPGRDLPGFAVGIGLHSGEAIIGNIGSPTRMEFTAIGDTVNLASRLEGMTKQLGCAILASESTIVSAGESVVCGRSEVITVKGREAPVRVFEVLSVNPGEKR
ncbi:MAG: adenylate/guanylate cyclase domain-containing protein [Rhodocyclaceae bacterium]|nr:adenylate/guanylate cyclase domain-containing protein [Rhodocyclaceae bacterium]MBZ0131910.1 adenylate/guanylate cyclase domain-containing protein [Rhodocyclaceae bacterium]MCB1891775.1 adenylate/guanylate cyclase domain-containing protein [Rhodocyclaceae bacterium]MCW5596866.1 adenylate/guanylate cyclase domain-containing protein [Rhodocyclaceae bacterium]PKO67780.1 MAG: adenylate/guanylate cyclase domain-containing protein [Betaproteobacteria bacterium HGW-Betaproteobacteria-14]